MGNIAMVMAMTKVKMQCAAAKVKNAWTEKLTADDKLVVSLVLIVIAIALCIVFRDAIKTLMQSIFKDSSDEIKKLYREGTTG